MSYSTSSSAGKRPVRQVRPLSGPRDGQPPRGITPPLRQSSISSTSGYRQQQQNFDDEDWLARSAKNLRNRQESAKGTKAESLSRANSASNVSTKEKKSTPRAAWGETQSNTSTSVQEVQQNDAQPILLTEVPVEDETEEQEEETNWAQMSSKLQFHLDTKMIQDAERQDLPTSEAAKQALQQADQLVAASRARADSQRAALQEWIDRLRPETSEELAALKNSAEQDDEEETDQLVEFPGEFDDAVGLAVEVVSSASKTNTPADTSFVPAFLQKYFNQEVAVKQIPLLREEQKAIMAGDSTEPKSYLTPEVKKGLEQIKRLDEVLQNREKSASKKRAALERCRQRFEAQRDAELSILEEKKRDAVEEGIKKGMVPKPRRQLGERLSSCGSSVAPSTMSVQPVVDNQSVPPSETGSRRSSARDMRKGPDGMPGFMQPRGRDRRKADYSVFEEKESYDVTASEFDVSGTQDLALLAMDSKPNSARSEEQVNENEDLLDFFVTAMDDAKKHVQQENFDKANAPVEIPVPTDMPSPKKGDTWQGWTSSATADALAELARESAPSAEERLNILLGSNTAQAQDEPSSRPSSSKGQTSTLATIPEMPNYPVDPNETGFRFSGVCAFLQSADEDAQVQAIDDQLRSFQDPEEASKIMSFADYMEQSKFMKEVEMQRSGIIVPKLQVEEEEEVSDVKTLLANGGLTAKQRARIQYQASQEAQLEMRLLGADLRRIDHSLAEVARDACDSTPQLSRQQIDELMASARANVLPNTMQELDQTEFRPSPSPVDSLDDTQVTSVSLGETRRTATEVLSSARETNRSAWRVMEEVESALRAAEDGLATQEILEKRNPNLFDEEVYEQKFKERIQREESRLQGQMSQADEIQKTAEEWFSSMNKLEQKLVVEDMDEDGVIPAQKTDDSDEDDDKDDDPFRRIEQAGSSYRNVDQLSDAGSLHLDHVEGEAPADSTLNIALRRLGLHEEVERAGNDHQENPNAPP